MAAPSGQLKVSRYFAVLAVIIAVIYALVFFTGNKKPEPKLGLDLKGGTTMTLSATNPGGKPPDAAKLEQARQIIANRVDSTGVAEPEVVTEGNNNIVVNVAGNVPEATLRSLVAPAVLRFRAVLGTTQDQPASAIASASASPSASASASGKASTGASASASAASKAASPSASASASPTTSASPSAGSSASASPSAAAASPTTSPSGSASQEQMLAQVKQQVGPTVYALGESIAASMTDPSTAPTVSSQQAEALLPFSKLSGAQVAALPAKMQYAIPDITCKQLDDRPPGSVVDPNQQVASCESGDTHTKYFLDTAKVLGTDVSGASSGYDTNEGGWNVRVSFTSKGGDKWTALTKAQVQKQVAIVLDNDIVSAPVIQSVIVGDAIINGGGINQQTAATLASQLKYGSLPLNFTIQTVGTVTATLGLAQMQAGLLAGLIGLILVIVYCLLYYRSLGLVVIASLGVSASILYGMLVLLGRSMGYTLTLAGIAGFIVAIGITADSFVVFFERLKDEVKDGRAVRSAVPRAWVRARKTIISADAVSFLAALVLYLLGGGEVKGFAFTLGMSTLVDLLIVFMFTHPLVALLSRSATFTSPRFSGLGNLREGAPAPATPAGRFGAMRTKES